MPHFQWFSLEAGSVSEPLCSHRMQARPSGIGGQPEIVDGVRTWLEEGAGALSPFFIPRCLVNLATGQVAIRYRARGPSLVVATACPVGNHSVGEAWRAIRYE